MLWRIEPSKDFITIKSLLGSMPTTGKLTNLASLTRLVPAASSGAGGEYMGVSWAATVGASPSPQASKRERGKDALRIAKRAAPISAALRQYKNLHSPFTKSVAAL